MPQSASFEKEFKKKGNKAAESVAGKVLKKRAMLKELMDCIQSPEPKIKLAAAKTVRIISEEKPALLYSRFDFFYELIGHKNNILKWIAIDVIGNMASVDKNKKINRRVLQLFVGLLRDIGMITASHSIDALWKIAMHKPRLRSEITKELLRVDKIKRNEDCRNILIGKVILAFEKYSDRLRDKKPIASFVRRQIKNPKVSTGKKAERYLKNLK